MCGSFYFYTMSNRIPFQKPYASAHDLVRLLQSPLYHDVMRTGVAV